MTLQHCLILSILVFSIGVYGLLTRRNIIAVLMSIELLLNSAQINFVSFACFGSADPGAGTIFAVFLVGLTSAEMAVALAIVVAMYRRFQKMDVEELDHLHG